MLITTCYLFPKKNTETKNAEWLILQKIKRPQMQVLSMDVDHLGNSAASGSYYRILIDGHACMYVRCIRYIHIGPDIYNKVYTFDIEPAAPLALSSQLEHYLHYEIPRRRNWR